MKMKNFMIAALVAVVGALGLGMVPTGNASAKVICSNGESKEKLSECPEWSGGTGVAKNDSLMTTLTTIINVVVGVVGFVAVAMIVMGGISFATSQGDSSKTTKARNTILYGVVGLVVALLAFAIVNFVLTNVF